MSDKIHTSIDSSQAMVYQIKLQGHLHLQWADWFDGMHITLEDNGETLLTGPVVDQSALYGLLRKVRDLGLPLLSLNSIQAKATGESSPSRTKGSTNVSPGRTS